MLNSFPPESRQVMIREFEGDLHPFDPAVLQTRLIGCFLAAGLRESVDMPQDIALAVEYTLLNAPRQELIFGRGELECAVIRLLEEIGFPEVAKLYRSGNGGEQELYVTPHRETLEAMLKGHIGCSGELFSRVIDRVIEGAGKLEIKQAPAHLLLELARYYERILEQQSARCAVEHTPEITLSAGAIPEMLPEATRVLIRQNILRIDGVTTLFPCVHLFFRMVEFARQSGMNKPLTELEVEPLLYEVSIHLAAVQNVIEEHLHRKLPVILAVPDMFEFIAEYAGGAEDLSGNLATELGNVLCSGFSRGVYKLKFD